MTTIELQLAGFGDRSHIHPQVDELQKALRVHGRPTSFKRGGVYRAAFNTGVIAAGAAGGSVFFAFRWTESEFMGVVQRVRLTAGTDTTAFAQGSTIFDLIRAQAFTAQYTGGATLNLLGLSQAKSTDISSPSKQYISNSAVGNIAIANTGALAAGTPAPTFDNNALAVLVGSVGAVPLCYPVTQPGLLLDEAGPNDNPLELYQNEGFVIRGTVPGTGTWKLGVDVTWLEVDPTEYYA